MVPVFLKDKRFREPILRALKDIEVSVELILEGNIADERQNVLRKRALGLFRGYPDREIFEHYPPNAVWKYAVFEAADLDQLRYVDYSYWNELSKGTSAPVWVAETKRI